MTAPLRAPRGVEPRDGVACAARRALARRALARPRVVGALAAALLGLAVVPPPVAGHQLVGRVESPLPLWAYLGGAGVAVALSFAFVFARQASVVRRPVGRSVGVPRWIRWPLRAAGLVGWAWVLVQSLAFPGSSSADVSSLFLWVYGWVGIALVSALVGPIWAWLDPFSAIHDAGAWVMSRLGVRGWAPAAYPEQLGAWPAAIGYGFFVWLELIVTGGGGGRVMGVVLLGYTLLTLLGMAQFGKTAWRSGGDVFSVWFATLGRIAPFTLDGSPEAGRVRRRALGAGLLEPGWSVPLVALVAFAVVGVIFDGVSQTRLWVDLFGLPSLPQGTLLLAAALGGAAAVVLGVARLVGGSVSDHMDGWRVGLASLGAGLSPIAVGYITAHYLTFLLIDGQRILVAISDPFQQGWDLFGTAFQAPTAAFLPAALVWMVQLAAVVGGHMAGAWFGHVAATEGGGRGVRARQLPLSALMVTLTVTTLWSLGQAIVAEPGQGTAAGGVPRHGASAIVASSVSAHRASAIAAGLGPGTGDAAVPVRG